MMKFMPKNPDGSAFVMGLVREITQSASAQLDALIENYKEMLNKERAL